jgi:hypothetical protein
MKLILEGETDNDVEIVKGGSEGAADNLDDVERSEREVTTTENVNTNCPVEKELRRQGITLKELVSDNPRLSLDWQPFRAVTQCSCASPIDSLTRKVSFYNNASFHFSRYILEFLSQTLHNLMRDMSGWLLMG